MFLKILLLYLVFFRLVFSQSLYSLDLIEQFLWKIDEATQKNETNENLAGHVG